MDTSGELGYAIFLLFAFFVLASSEDSFSEIYALILAGLLGAGVIYQFFIKDEITLYSQTQICDEKKNCEWKNNNRFTFKVIDESQQVIYWNKENLMSLDKATDCRIRDRENWWCDKHGGEPFGFLDGEWFNYGTSFYGERGEFREVMFIRWWFTRWMTDD